MWRLTPDEYKQLLARSVDLQGNDTRKNAKRESSTSPQPKREDETKAAGASKGTARYQIRVTSYRRRHLDPDNVFPKWHIDALVAARVIEDDSSKYVESIIKRVVVSSDTEEKTEIEIWRVK